MRKLFLVLLAVASLAAVPAASLGATPKAVVFGNKTTLAGALGDKQAGVSVQILETQCGSSQSITLTTVKSGTGGIFGYQAQPLRQTAYTARVKNSDSTAAIFKVMPRLRLGRVARHTYAVHLFAAESFAGKIATFQRYQPEAPL